jgi:holo-[acyl-carrier protein] synthase
MNQPIAHGVDLVEVARIAEMLDRHGDTFVKKCFTEEEAVRGRGGPRYAEHLAGRFAAKEAVMKAIGTGWSRGVGWTDVHVERHPSGAPVLRVEGQAGRIAAELGITRWMISLSHTSTHAMASVIGIGPGT